MITILQGDVVDKLRELKDQSIHSMTSSPAYWGLRDYSANKEFKTKAEADSWSKRNTKSWNELYGSPRLRYVRQPSTEKYDKEVNVIGWIGHIAFETLWEDGVWCPHGLEKTPEQYITHTLEIFREVWRVLRDDGTVWLNMGDCYCGYKGENYGVNPETSNLQSKSTVPKAHDIGSPVTSGLKPKDLIGMPWRLAFALQKEGWYLRSDIIWSKPNPMPESVTDRPTKSHEYVFLLTKKARYFYDSDAIREPHQTSTFERAMRGNSDTHKNLDVPGREVHTMHLKRAAGEGMEFPARGRNRRTVWEIATQPFPEAHFATFPEALVEPCIKAGTSEWGCCPVCGAPWERVVEKDNTLAESRRGTRGYESRGLEAGNRFASETPGYTTISKTLGWQPTCKCEGYYDFDQEKWFDYQKAIPCTVLDPFMGSGTTLKVARDLKRDAIGIEINPEYVKIARERLRLNEQLVMI